jgi:peptidoglycan/xylan/chitin deacetylase (PgdA/CDA1 family)
MSFKSTIDKLVPKFIETAGHLLNPVILTFKNGRNKLLIFYFHGLYDSLKQKDLHHADPQNNITVSQFSEFVEYFLNHKYHFIKPEDLLKPLQPNERYVMITFDDGYFNNMLAIGVLKKFNIPATFFLSTYHIKEGKSYWWDIIYKYRYKQGYSLTNIRNEQQQLKKLNWSDIDTYIKKEFGDAAFNPWSDIDRPFTESELKSISQNGLISIGNHTIHHAILTNYSDDEIKREIYLCSEYIAEITGKNPIAIAFPNGNFNANILSIAQKTGLRIAFTTRNYINNMPITNDKIICLDRFMARTESIKKYESFVRIGYTPEGLYSNLKKRMARLKK